MIKTVGIGEIAISSNPLDTIVTHALGSCVAVTVYCKRNSVAGMIHIALPQIPERAFQDSIKPGYYADMGIETLIHLLSLRDCNHYASMDVSVIGGANPIGGKDYFKIGQRNLSAVRTILKHKGINFRELEVSGTVSRTVWMHVKDGTIEIKSHPLII